MASSSPTTDRSTAGATSGATQTGTPSRSANVSTFPKPNRKVRATMIPTISVTADSTGSRPALELNTAPDLPGGPHPDPRPPGSTCTDTSTESGTHVPEKCPRGLAHVDRTRYSSTQVMSNDQPKRSCSTSLDITRHLKTRSLNQRVQIPLVFEAGPRTDSHRHIRCALGANEHDEPTRSPSTDPQHGRSPNSSLRLEDEWLR